ncbi:MAG: hypothetical protein K0R17_1042 [Rariglobus sp.]|jgi:hypothetical protein|nr:hypothetical protein [Rariglobus sp.]
MLSACVPGMFSNGSKNMDSSNVEKDRPARPASDSLFVHIVDEMPLRVVLAVTFVAFFFAWGAVNNLTRLFVRDVHSLDSPFGVYAGLLAAIATPLVIWRIKRRTK